MNCCEGARRTSCPHNCCRDDAAGQVAPSVVVVSAHSLYTGSRAALLWHTTRRACVIALRQSSSMRYLLDCCGTLCALIERVAAMGACTWCTRLHAASRASVWGRLLTSAFSDTGRGRSTVLDDKIRQRLCGQEGSKAVVLCIIHHVYPKIITFCLRPWRTGPSFELRASLSTLTQKCSQQRVRGLVGPPANGQQGQEASRGSSLAGRCARNDRNA